MPMRKRPLGARSLIMGYAAPENNPAGPVDLTLPETLL